MHAALEAGRGDVCMCVVWGEDDGNVSRRKGLDGLSAGPELEISHIRRPVMLFTERHMLFAALCSTTGDRSPFCTRAGRPRRPLATSQCTADQVLGRGRARRPYARARRAVWDQVAARPAAKPVVYSPVPKRQTPGGWVHSLISSQAARLTRGQLGDEGGERRG
eukprot:scaffold123284_cov32-Tisochrysis_lutea.AAC.1